MGFKLKSSLVLKKKEPSSEEVSYIKKVIEFPFYTRLLNINSHLETVNLVGWYWDIMSFRLWAASYNSVIMIIVLN